MFHNSVKVTANGAECLSNQNRECFGGVARLKYQVDTLREKYPNSVFLNAGDFFQVRIFFHQVLFTYHQTKAKGAKDKGMYF